MTNSAQDTLLLRQVNPKFLNNDQLSAQSFLTSAVFNPSRKDAGLLSVHSSEFISAKESVELFAYPTCGAVAVTPHECSSVELPTRPDPIGESLLERAHHVIDYTSYSGSQQKVKATILKKNAEKRGFIYKP